MVRGEGIEPSTNWLKANCSTAELPALSGKGAGMYSCAWVAQAGICPGADFLNQRHKTAFGSLDREKMRSGTFGTFRVAFCVITDVQAVFRRTASSGQRSLKHARVRFRCANFAGDDDGLEKPQQIVSAEDRAQAPIEVRQHQHSMIAREIIQSGQNVVKNRPCQRLRVMLIKFGKQIVERVLRKRLRHHTSKHLRHQCTPPATVIVHGWLPRRMKGRRSRLPHVTKGSHHIIWRCLDPVTQSKLSVGGSNRLCGPDKSACGVKEQRT
jgi:hypothetical protein